MSAMPAANVPSLSQVLCIKADSPSTFFTSCCCRSDGALMVINGGNNRIHVYSSGGKLIQSNFGNRLLNKRFKEPTLITELPNQRVAILDRATHQIKKLGWNEDHVDTFDIGMPTYSLTTNSYGHLVMGHQASKTSRTVTIRNSDNGYIIHTLKIKPEQHTVPETPFYAAYSQQNNIVVVDQSSCTLSMYTLQGVKTSGVGKIGFLHGNLDNPRSLCLDHRGNAIIADSKNDRIVRYRCDNSKQCDILLTDIHRPLCVQIDKNNNLVVLTAKDIRVYEYDIKIPTAPTPVLISGI